MPGVIWDQLYPFQKEAANFAASRSGSALFLEQGCGKTWITAGLIEQLMSRSFSGLLIVPLSNIQTTWETLLKRLPLRICRTWEAFKAASVPRVLLLHYEAVHRLIKRLRKQAWTLVVYDESQRLKGRGTKASRDAAKFKDVKHRVILSGTPVEQAPQDLWAQFRFALPDVLGTRWADFAGQWLMKTGYMGYKWKFVQSRLPRFLRVIHPHILRVRKQEVLDLPPLTLHRSPLDLTGEQARVYADLENDYYTRVGGRDVIADLEITQLVRLQQVCGGFVKTDPVRDESRGLDVTVGTAKVDWLRTFLTKNGDWPVVIFCKYRQEILRCVAVLAQLGISYNIIHGKNRKERSSIVRKFQAGVYRALVCQIKTGGVGIDLFRASVAVFYSLTFSSIDFDQAVCRLHRHGQTRPVQVFLPYVRNTVDESIFDRILSKQLVAQQVLERKGNMAKLEKGKKEEPSKKEPEKKVEEKKTDAEDKPKYGVPQLAEALEIEPSTVRIRLRNAEIGKNGKRYGWETKKEFEAVLKTLKETSSAKKKDEEDDEEEAA